MKGFQMYQAQVLLKQGYSRSTVANILNVSRRTIYNYEKGLVYKDNTRHGRPAGKSKLSPFYSQIDAALERDFTLNSVNLYEELKKAGYTGKISILRDYMHRKRQEMQNTAVRRFETLPGKQAQVDWMYAGTVLENGRRKKRYAFIMKLGYSRRSYVEFTTSMEQSVLFACMIHAFEYFGGVPAEILFDNMKTAFVYNETEGKWQVNAKMAAFAAHYGFTPRRCRVYRPKTKGKVEREVRYVRTSFLPSVGTDISNVPTSRLNELVELWMERVDGRILRDFGQSRLERFEQEKHHLINLPETHFEYRLPKPLFVNREGYVTLDTNRYSVPSKYRGKFVEGFHDLLENKLTLRYESAVIKTVRLEAAGAKKTITSPEDEHEHYIAWCQGLEFEERVRGQIQQKRKQAEDENHTADPAIYDQIFVFSSDIVKEAAI